MKDGRSPPLARALFGAGLLFAASGAVVQGVAKAYRASDTLWVPLGISIAVGFAWLGLLIVRIHPRNAIGWLFLGSAAFWAASNLALSYAFAAVPMHETSSLLAKIADWSGQWSWMPLVFLLPALLALLFPDGRPLSPRWRIAVWGAVVCSLVTVVSSAVAPGSLEDPVFLKDNPFAVDAPWLIDAASAVGWLGMLAVFASALASLVVRLRRSVGEERQQMKWLAFSVGFAIVIVAIGSIVASTAGVTSKTTLGSIVIAAILASIAFIPVAAGVAILKYRLYDIDVVINRTVVFGALAAFITAVYVAIVVGVGTALGSERNPLLSLVAIALVAIAFQPVRDRVQRFANRLVYGDRATPYEVMAGFSRRVSETLSIDQVLPEMAAAAAQGVGASRSHVQVYLPGGGDRRVSWPDANGEILPDRTIAVSYQGSPIGEIGVSKPYGESLTPAEERLLADLASQAGLALHNVRLTEELEAKLVELSAQSAALQVSRQRLVTARDAQRRGLERDIREGPQRQLTLIAQRLDAATALVDGAPEEAESILDALGEQTASTLEGLRDLARGVFPPLLAEKGVLAALEAHIRKIGASATVEAGRAFAECRFDADTEACVYFCCLQAIQNASRHAGGVACRVLLDADDDSVGFEVDDEGSGFDVASTPRGMGISIMQDRVDALDGELVVESGPGEGTRVRGRVATRREASAR